MTCTPQARLLRIRSRYSVQHAQQAVHSRVTLHAVGVADGPIAIGSTLVLPPANCRLRGRVTPVTFNNQDERNSHIALPYRGEWHHRRSAQHEARNLEHLKNMRSNTQDPNSQISCALHHVQPPTVALTGHPKKIFSNALTLPNTYRITHTTNDPVGPQPPDPR